jgi:hypothetical protein
MSFERLVFMLDGLRRSWILFLLPLVLAAPLAYGAWKFTPIMYEAKSAILMVSANRGAESPNGFSGLPRNIVTDQVAVLEAWLKSDQVFGELLPQLLDGPVPSDPEVRANVTDAFRRSLTLEVIGSSVLEMRLAGSDADGLGRKLEIIIARLLEGVINPEAGILSASQMIVARRGAALAEAEAALNKAITAVGNGEPGLVKAKLEALSDRKNPRGAAPTRFASRGGLNEVGGLSIQPAARINSAEPISAEDKQQLDALRASISSDPQIVASLERLFEAHLAAKLAFQDAQDRAGNSATSYVRVFDAPERLTVIGRPRDPVKGTSTGRKLAIALMLAAFLGGIGLVGVAVMLDPMLRIGEDFEQTSGLQVIARLRKVRAKR